MTDLNEVKKEVGEILNDKTLDKASCKKNKLRNYLFPLVRDNSITNFVIEDIKPLENQDFTVKVIKEKSFVYTVKGTKVSIE